MDEIISQDYLMIMVKKQNWEIIRKLFRAADRLSGDTAASQVQTQLWSYGENEENIMCNGDF